MTPLLLLLLLLLMMMMVVTYTGIRNSWMKLSRYTARATMRECRVLRFQTSTFRRGPRFRLPTLSLLAKPMPHRAPRPAELLWATVPMELNSGFLNDAQSHCRKRSCFACVSRRQDIHVIDINVYLFNISRN